MVQLKRSRLLVKVEVAPPSHINELSKYLIDLVLANALCALPMIKIVVSTRIIITLSASPPFLSVCRTMSGISQLVSGKCDQSFASMGVTDEAIATCLAI